jgi:hypothetical protein
MKPNHSLRMMDMWNQRIGEPNAILCMRYWYRGFLVSASEDLLVLSNAFAVEQTGPAANVAPQREDAIPCDVHINPNVMEIGIQPAWCVHGYTKEQMAEMKKKKNQGLRMKDMWGKRMGEPVAILCMRYWYRGFLVSASEDLVVLSNAFAVEQTGPAANVAPQREDAIPCDVPINPNVIEIIIQPAWCVHGYTKEQMVDMKKQFGPSNM